jgi:uncharacterized repeat protein (TIGR03803 family)
MTSANFRKVLSVTLIALACTAASAAQGFHVIHSFNAPGDGSSPLGRLISDKQGNLYGTTSAGGAYGYGSVFELTPPSTSGGSWTETILYSFQGSYLNRQSPQSGLVIDGKGNLYGTTFWGGINNNGTVFELSPPAVSGGAWTETTLYEFGSLGIGGQGLLYNPAGVLFGTTVWGENVYELKIPASGGTALVKNLFSFNAGTNGEEPLYEGGPLVADTSGNLYGTTLFGGAYGYGEVFEVSPPAVPGGPWTESVLFSFGGFANDGTSPAGSVALDAAGNVYSTTKDGGLYNQGTVVKLSPPAAAGLPWTETILYSFAGATSDGGTPWAGLVIDKSGNLYGVTYAGGVNGVGTVFKVSQSGGVWTETVLHTFDIRDGEMPWAGLMVRGNRLYGATSACAGKCGGTIFEVIP